jgi:hypothetical protein
MTQQPTRNSAKGFVPITGNYLMTIREEDKVVDSLEWLKNMVAADLGLTTQFVKDSQKINNHINDYAKGIIWDYQDLLKILQEKKEA